MERKIVQNRMDCLYDRYKEEFEKKALEVLRSGWYVLGREVKAFEDEWAKYCGAKYCTGVNSGLDALIMAFRALGIGPGDEVIIQGNAYIASVMGVTINGAVPVFVEPDEYHSIDASRIEEKITDRTKAVLIVHLFGMPAQMDKITEICTKYHLRLVEDCAQSHGAVFHGKMTGTFGDAGCFSFYPSKNLGAFGDAGAVLTNDEGTAKKIRMYRNYGSEKRYYNKVVGMNSRLDEMQAGLLRVKLRHLKEINEERNRIAMRYTNEIRSPFIRLPKSRENAKCIWHQYVLECAERDRLKKYLDDNNIGTLIHYPVPPHLSEAYAYLGYKEGELPVTERKAKRVLSLPLYNGMTDDEVTYVISKLNEF